MVNYSEYNKTIIPNAELLSGFFARLDHAVQKSGAYDEVMHQLLCIGLGERLVEVANEAAALYKAHHRARIEAEQGRPATLNKDDAVYCIVSETKGPDEYHVVTVEEAVTTMDVARERLLVIWRANMTKFVCEKWSDLNGMALAIEQVDDAFCVYAKAAPQNVYCRMYIKESKLS